MVERTALEMRRTREGTVGSNPTLSAKIFKKIVNTLEVLIIQGLLVVICYIPCYKLAGLQKGRVALKRVKSHRYLYRRGDMFYFRKGVPDAAVEAFGGRREVQVSLHTSTLAEARHALIVEIDKFEAQLATTTGAATPKTVLEFSRARVPTKQEIEEKARAWLELRASRLFVGDLSGEEGLARGRSHLADLEAYSNNVAQGIAFGASGAALTTSWIAESLTEDCGWHIDPGSELWRHLIRTIGRGQIEVSAWQAQDIKGQPRAISDVTFAPEQYRLDVERQRERDTSKQVSLAGLLDDYMAQATLAAATVKAWKRQVRAFTAHIGHDDANRVRREDIVGWRTRLLTQPNAAGKVLSAKTVRDTYLAVLKTIFIWAASDGKIRSNPTDGVKVIGQRKQVLRERGLNDAEANIILTATMAIVSGRLTAERALAQRWVPWICAYTGARVNEITQLRAEDVTKTRGIWTIRITPEAGSTKNGEARIVPLHPHLVEQGFPDVVKEKQGPLFYDPKRYRNGLAGNPQSKKVGEHLARWVRKIGVSDPNVQPNHGWRHRFKTQARLADMNPEIRDAIQGHAARTEGEGYGDTLPEVALRELTKLPRYRLEGTA